MKVNCLLNEKQYPIVHGSSSIVDGQYDPGEQKVSLEFITSDHMSAPPQVWLGFPGGIWYVYL